MLGIRSLHKVMICLVALTNISMNPTAAAPSVGDTVTLTSYDEKFSNCMNWDPWPSEVELKDVTGHADVEVLSEFYELDVTTSEPFQMSANRAAFFNMNYSFADNWQAIEGEYYAIYYLDDTSTTSQVDESTDCPTELIMNNGSEEIVGVTIWFTFVLIQTEPGTSTSTTTPDPLTYTNFTTKSNGISFIPDNYDPTCTYELSSTKGTVLQDPVTGKVTVYGVGSGSSVSVTITDCTGATATVSGTATAPTAPVIATTKPTLSMSGTSLICTAGTSSVTPTSVAYTLYIDGVAVSTKFTDTAIAPSLVPTTEAQNSYSGATLSSASWTMDPAWASKVPSCATTSLANGAVGVARS
jgi:hypothetical protein